VSLREQIQSDLTNARRSSDILRRDVLGMVYSALYSAEKTKLEPLTDEEVEGVLAREVKMRRESIDAFRSGGRDDLAAKEEAELRILEEYLPPLDDQQLAGLIDEAIATTGATSARDMRAVMDWLRPRTAGRADGKRVGGLVAQRLARTDVAAHDSGSH
jgi:uncharacterized protein YqeY